MCIRDRVTNPPIDAIREQIVTSTYTLFGCEQNLLTSSELNCRKVRALSPILTNEELEKLRNIDLEGFKSITIPSLFNVKQENDMENAMDTIFEAADIAIENGYNIIILLSLIHISKECCIFEYQIPFLGYLSLK